MKYRTVENPAVPGKVTVEAVKEAAKRISKRHCASVGAGCGTASTRVNPCSVTTRNCIISRGKIRIKTLGRETSDNK